VLESYTEIEFENLQKQVDETIERMGIDWTTNELRKAVESRRRIRWGTLNGMLLLRHIDSLIDET